MASRLSQLLQVGDSQNLTSGLNLQALLEGRNGNGRPQQPSYPPGTILDPYGIPFPTGSRYDNYPVPHVMTFSALIGQAWRKFWHGKHDEAIRHSRENAMAMRRDSSVQCLLRERRRAFVNLPWHIAVDNEKDPHEKALKDGLTKLVQMTPRFKTMLWYLSDACWFGRYGSQLRFTWKELDMPAANSGLSILLNPKVAVDPMRSPKARRRVLVVDRSDDDDGHIPVNGDKIGHDYSGEPYILVMAAQPGGQQLPPGLPLQWATLGRAIPLRGWLRKRFIMHKFQEGLEDADWYDAEQADTIGGVGIRSSIYFLDFIKKEWLSNISDWVERAGLGIRVWYYQEGNAESKRKVGEAAKENMHRINILIPVSPEDRSGRQSQSVEWIEPTGTGPDLILRLIEYVEKWHERFIVGQSMSGGVKGEGHGGGMGGSHWAELAADTKSDITMSDANALAETITVDYLDTLKKYSYPEYLEIPAYFRFGEDHKEAAKKLDAAEKAWEMGASLKENEVVEAAGFTMPTMGDAVLKKAPDAAPGIPGAPGSAPPGQDQEEGGDPTDETDDESKESKDAGESAEMPKQPFWMTAKYQSLTPEERRRNAVYALCAHAQETDLDPELYGLDLDSFLSRLKQINSSEARSLYQHLLSVLDRYSDLRQLIGTSTLATIRAYS